jgi:hypothetical protein
MNPSAVISDPVMCLLAIREANRICGHCLEHLHPDSGLSRALAQVSIRLLYLERHHHLSSRDQSYFRDQERALQQFLSPGLTQ